MADSLIVRSLLAAFAAVAAAVLLAAAAGHGGAAAGGVPVVWWCAGAAFGIQWLAFLPAWWRRTERTYDLIGSLTYLIVTALALALTARRDPRSLLLAAMVACWALRLAAFLYSRVRRQGGDSRFDEIKNSGPDFFMAWTLQGLWVFVTLSPVLAAVTAGAGAGLGAPAAGGFLLWCTGFVFEIVADRQKRRFRADERNHDDFIRTGLWAWSRHPNYFGEIVLWIGVAVVASPTLQGWRWMTLLSPVFVAFLLTRVSGIPILERRADERWGGRAEYEAYKGRTPVLVPRPPRGRDLAGCDSRDEVG